MLSIFVKQFLLSNSFIKTLFPPVFLFVIMFGGFACGKRVSPEPPVGRVAQRLEIEGFQRGDRITLNWIMPAYNESAPGISNITRVDVYRLTERLDSPQTLSAEEFSNGSVLIASIPVEKTDFGLKKFGFTDVLEFAGQNVRLRYGIRAVNSSGQKASFSNFLLIEPFAKVAGAPNSLTIQSTEAANSLRWLPPRANVDGSEPANIAGYNIYRSQSAKETAVLLNKNPVGETEFRDEKFEFEKKYFYFVRSVSLGGDGNFLESAESTVVEITPADVFPPAPPAAITIAAAPGNLSLFFAANTESDVAGYRVYRSTDRSAALSDWQNLTPELLLTNTFQDANVSTGKTYYYYLTAVDKAGNASQPSEIVSETAL